MPLLLSRPYSLRPRQMISCHCSMICMPIMSSMQKSIAHSLRNGPIELVVEDIVSFSMFSSDEDVPVSVEGLLATPD